VHTRKRSVEASPNLKLVDHGLPRANRALPDAAPDRSTDEIARDHADLGARTGRTGPSALISDDAVVYFRPFPGQPLCHICGWVRTGRFCWPRFSRRTSKIRRGLCRLAEDFGAAHFFAAGLWPRHAESTMTCHIPALDAPFDYVAMRSLNSWYCGRSSALAPLSQTITCLADWAAMRHIPRAAACRRWCRRSARRDGPARRSLQAKSGAEFSHRPPPSFGATAAVRPSGVALWRGHVGFAA